MAKQRSFGGVNQATWDCVRAASAKEHGTVYAPDSESPDSGTATTKVSVIGDIVLRYEFDASKETVTYTIQNKPLIVRDDQIWDGIQESIDHCGS